MPSGRFSRNTVLAGVFVLIVVALFTFGVILLAGGGDLFNLHKSTYIIRFTLSQGADGLDKGSKVKLGGRRIGQVKSIDFTPDPASGEPIQGLLVKVEIDSSIRLYSDAEVTLVRPLLGSNSTLNIVSLRTTDTARLVAPGETLDGRPAPPPFLSQADYASIQNVIKRVNRWTETIDNDWPKPYDDVRATITDIRATVGSAREKWEAWSGQIDPVIRDLRPRFERLAQDIQEGVEKAKAAVENVRQIVESNRPRIDQAIKDAQEFIANLRGEAYTEAMAAIRKGRETMEYAADVARRADEVMTTSGPELGEIIAKASLAAQELKLAMSEIRAAPWRLLYQPNKKELENELLYNSMRAYSQSLADARSAAAALESATRAVAATPQGAQPPVDPRTLDALRARLSDALDRSARHEREFFERFTRESPPGPPGAGARR